MPSLNWDGDTLAEILADMRDENLAPNQIGIFGCSDTHINFEADGKEYVLTLHEVKDGEHWSEYLHKSRYGRWLKNGRRYCECSVCHHEGNTSGADNYCWYCGSRMDGEQDG